MTDYTNKKFYGVPVELDTFEEATAKQ